MNRDDVLRMAREAGFRVLLPDEHIDEIGIFLPTDDDCLPEMERFAALVAAAEREECAKVCDEIAHELATLVGYVESGIADGCSTAIRARGES
jgi:hypothetical protein